MRGTLHEKIDEQNCRHPVFRGVVHPSLYRPAFIFLRPHTIRARNLLSKAPAVFKVCNRSFKSDCSGSKAAALSGVFPHRRKVCVVSGTLEAMWRFVLYRCVTRETFDLDWLRSFGTLIIVNGVVSFQEFHHRRRRRRCCHSPDKTSFYQALNYREELLNPKLMLKGPRARHLLPVLLRLYSTNRRKNLERGKSNQKDYLLSLLRAFIN